MRYSNMTSVKGLVLSVVMLMTVIATARGQEVYALEDKPTTVQLRTNGMYWLALSPNVGVELQTDMGVAFLADYVGAWWNSSKNHRYWSNYAFHLEGRYYLGAKEQITPYKGHHVGVYGYLATYDFEFGNKGYQCSDLSKTFSIGVSYGWSMPVNKRLSFDFTIGIGYLQSKYTEYIPSETWYKATGYKKMTWFGPTKLEATLVWNINNINKK